jgi:hypothetical protein
MHSLATLEMTFPMPEARKYTASFTHTEYTVFKTCVPTTIPGKTKANRQPQKQGEGEEADGLPSHPNQFIGAGWFTGLPLHA